MGLESGSAFLDARGSGGTRGTAAEIAGLKGGVAAWLEAGGVAAGSEATGGTAAETAGLKGGVAATGAVGGILGSCTLNEGIQVQVTPRTYFQSSDYSLET